MMAGLPVTLIPEQFYTPPQRRCRTEKMGSLDEPAPPTSEEGVVPLMTTIKATPSPSPQPRKLLVEEAVTQPTPPSSPIPSPAKSGSPPSSEDTPTLSVPEDKDEIVVIPEAPLDEQTLSLRELRQLCTDRGLSHAGKKIDLIKRLKSSS